MYLILSIIQNFFLQIKFPDNDLIIWYQILYQCLEGLDLLKSHMIYTHPHQEQQKKQPLQNADLYSLSKNRQVQETVLATAPRPDNLHQNWVA